MTGLRKTTVILGAIAIVGLVAGSALAGWVDTVSAYNDGTTEWKGTTSFDSGSDLAGSVEWAVFGPGQFPFSGYSPTAGSFTYVYQIHNSDTAPITLLSVWLENLATNIGSFDDASNGVTGDAVLTTRLLSGGGGYAEWEFSGIANTESSCGLVFSSSCTPMDYVGVMLNHGEYAFTEPLPSPSPNSIPEPGALALLASGLGLALMARWLRRR